MREGGGMMQLRGVRWRGLDLLGGCRVSGRWLTISVGMNAEVMCG
jgi:hypothetical protein